MALKLELTYCHKCQCAHAFGQHRGKPPAKLPPSLAQTPIAVALHTYPDGQSGHSAKATDRNYVKELSNSPRQKKPPKDPLKPPFNKDEFQRLYMSDRREADDLGFGGSRNPRHPNFNPRYMTVSQFRQWKAQQGRK